VEGYTQLSELVEKYPQLLPVKDKIGKAADCLVSCYQHGGKVLVCGNGGSSSDSDHIVGELMKGFERKRNLVENVKNELVLKGGDRGKYLSEKLQQGLPAISLSAHSGLISAIANDTDANLIFAQQVIGYGNKGDILLALSTSGNSQNILDAIITAKAKGMTVIGMTGETGGKIASVCDILINVPGKSTVSVQELHLPVYHALCLMIETSLFGNIK
jgi:phosphoheptose isomerase